MTSFLKRPNMILRQKETWRPPVYSGNTGVYGKVVSLARRFFDLQNGSIYRDLSIILKSVKGIVLDVGCGAQPYRTLIPKGVLYRGIDKAEVGAAFGYKVKDVEYYSGDVWPVSESSCDVVMSTETLEHVDDPYTFLSEARRCLQPMGILILTVPFAARWHYIPYDYWRFTPSGLKTILEKSGFGNVEVFARGNELTVACYKIMALILPLIMVSDTGSFSIRAVFRRVLGLFLFPVLIILAFCGNLSLLGEGGDDCLGYTVTAARLGDNGSVARG